MKIGIATDHGGFGLKEELLTKLRGAGHKVIDVRNWIRQHGLADPDQASSNRQPSNGDPRASLGTRQDHGHRTAISTAVSDEVPPVQRYHTHAAVTLA